MNIPKNKKWYERYELLFVVLLAGLFTTLVLASINRFSIWHDEGYTATLIENDYRGIVERTAMDVHPPLYYLLLKTWSMVFGNHILTLRLFSFVCMLAAILVTWRIIRKLYGVREGLVAMAAMAVGPFLVRYGQEMRMYGLAALLASLATYVYIHTLMTKKAPAWFYVMYGLLILAGMYTQYFFILVPTVHAFHLFFIQQEGNWLQRFKGSIPMIISGLVVLLGFAVWVPTVHKQFSEVQGSFWIPKVNVETLTSTPIAMTLFRKQFQLSGFNGLLAVIALILVVVLVGKFFVTKRSKESRLLFMSIVLPPVLLFLLSLPPFQPSYQDRYMSFMAPIFYSVLGMAILYFAQRWQRIALGVAVVVMLLGFGQISNYWDGNNHGWEPQPYFTMNNIIDQVDDDAPVYSSSLWTYFDAHITIRDRGMPNQTTVLLDTYPNKWMGNWSAIYRRDDLISTYIPDDTKTFWLIEESGTPQYHGDQLNKYKEISSLSNGYAKIVKYQRL